MKSIIMSIKSSKIMKVSLLVLFTSLLPLVNISAQKKLNYKNSGAPVEVGDSVMINRDSLYYETGERILGWVYDQVHEVRQVSSKFHPDGILVKGIYSWLTIGSVVNVNEKNVDKVEAITPEPIVEEPTPEPVVEPTSASTSEPIVESNQEIASTSTHETVVESTPEIVVETTPEAPAPEETDLIADEETNKSYQVDRFTIGLRGGFASSMARPASLPLGGDVLLDLQYAHYWAAAQDKIHFGLLAGISAGYMNTTRSQAWDETFTANTSDGDVIYNVTADNIKETNNQLQLEVPVMFSMITKGGLFVNVGPRFLLPAYAPYKQVITNGNIEVTDVETGVVLNNNPVYGALSAEQEKQKGQGEQQFKLTMTIGVEVGYEFKLKSGNSIGLGAFANYGVYSMYSNKPLGSAIDITAPNATENAVVRVESLTNAYTNKMGHLDAGIKLTYNLNFIK